MPPLLVLLLSRMYGLFWVIQGSEHPAYGWAPPPSSPPWVIWDGAWYVSIAANGYHAIALSFDRFGGYYDYAFLPLWPALIRLTSFGGLLPFTSVAFVLSNLFFVLAGLLIYRLFCARFAPGAAIWGLALFAFAPAAYAYSLGYTESLFLLLILGALMANPSAPRRFGVLVIAQLTRPVGFVLGFLELPRLWRSRGADRGAWLVLLAIPLSLGLWIAYIGTLTGDPLSSFRAVSAWNAAGGHSTGILSVLDLINSPGVRPVLAIAPLLLLVLGFVGIWHLYRSGRLDLALLSLGLIAPALIVDWRAAPRCAGLAFPVLPFTPNGPGRQAGSAC